MRESGEKKIEGNNEFFEKQKEIIEILKKISKLFNDNGIKWWMTGGFAVEANIGEHSLTRVHEDVDIIIPNSDIDRANEILSSSGFQIDQQEPFKTNILINGKHLVDILHYNFNENGDAVLETKDEIGRDVIYPAAVFDKNPKTYFDAEVFTVFPELIYLQQINSINPQKKHESDILQLKEIINQDRLMAIDEYKPYLSDKDMKNYKNK